MIIDNIKKLLSWIFVLIVMLGFCVAVDYADNSTVKCVKNQSKVGVANCTEVGGGVFVDDKVVKQNKSIIKVKSYDKIHYCHPVVSMWARPSVRCGLPYKWYYRSFIDYCPHCKRYNVLYDAHKPQAKWEHEWTCRRCGADYDAVVGKEKYSWSHYYLRRA